MHNRLEVLVKRDRVLIFVRMLKDCLPSTGNELLHLDVVLLDVSHTVIDQRLQVFYALEDKSRSELGHLSNQPGRALADARRRRRVPHLENRMIGGRQLVLQFIGRGSLHDRADRNHADKVVLPALRVQLRGSKLQCLVNNIVTHDLCNFSQKLG